MKLIGQLASSCFISFSKLIFNIVILSHLISEFAFLLVVVAGELKLD